MTTHTQTNDLLPRLQRSATQALMPLQREMNRFFEEFGEGWEALAASRPVPCMDAVETKSGMEITLELPGLSREDVTISIDEDLLTINGEKKSEKESSDRNYRVVERSFGRFSRSIHLPRSFDGGKLKATMADGVLKIVAPRRADAAGAKTIPIQSA